MTLGSFKADLLGAITFPVHFKGIVLVLAVDLGCYSIALELGFGYGHRIVAEFVARVIIIAHVTMFEFDCFNFNLLCSWVSFFEVFI